MTDQSPPVEVVGASPTQTPAFNFRRLTPEEDVKIPFTFQGETYTLRPKRVNALVAGDIPQMRIAMDSRPMWEFLQGVLAEDYERFRDAIRDPMLVIAADEFAEMVRWMIGAAGGRPT